MTDQEKIDALSAALEIYADVCGGIWENCVDDNEKGLRRCFIAGTTHPNEIARAALAKVNPTIQCPKQKHKDVHTEHCCILHGCKYGEDKNCTVVTRHAPQSYTCETCYWDGIRTLEQLHQVMEGTVKKCPHCNHVL